MLSMTALPVLAQEPLPPDPTLSGRFTAEPLGEFIIFDALVLRPLGLVSMGWAHWARSLPLHGPRLQTPRIA